MGYFVGKGICLFLVKELVQGHGESNASSFLFCNRDISLEQK
jgi:hypothetical protein